MKGKMLNLLICGMRGHFFYTKKRYNILYYIAMRVFCKNSKKMKFF